MYIVHVHMGYIQSAMGYMQSSDHVVYSTMLGVQMESWYGPYSVALPKCFQLCLKGANLQFATYASNKLSLYV